MGIPPRRPNTLAPRRMPRRRPAAAAACTVGPLGRRPEPTRQLFGREGNARASGDTGQQKADTPPTRGRETEEEYHQAWYSHLFVKRTVELEDRRSFSLSASA